MWKKHNKAELNCYDNKGNVFNVSIGYVDYVAFIMRRNNVLRSQ